MFGFAPLGTVSYGDSMPASGGDVILSLAASSVGADLALGVVIQEHVLALATNGIGSTLPNLFLGFNSETINLAPSRTVRFNGERRIVTFNGENRLAILGGENRSVYF